MKDQNQQQFLESIMIQTDQLKIYQNSILNILNRINLDSNDEGLKHDLKSIYQFLNLLNPKSDRS